MPHQIDEAEPIRAAGRVTFLLLGPKRLAVERLGASRPPDSMMKACLSVAFARSPLEAPPPPQLRQTTLLPRGPGLFTFFFVLFSG